MQIQALQQELHQLIDQIEDEELLQLYSHLLQRELKKNNPDFFNTSLDDLKSRAESSLKSISEGKTRNIERFKTDIELWKKKRNIS